MKKHLLPILAILSISSILRIWNLGNIPLGLSLDEVKLGTYLSTPFLIRIPFALIGVISVYFLYLIVKHVFNNEKLALISSFFLGVMPWHVQESRIFSWGVVAFFLGEVITLLIFRFVSKRRINLSKANLFIAIVFILTLVVVPVSGLATKVNDERLIVVNNSPKIFSRVFINKLTENYRQREQIFFTNIDFGNYFFAGHPRERVGISETQKLLIYVLPFVILGLFKIKKDEAQPLIAWTTVSLFVLTFFSWQGSQSLILVLPFIILLSVGVFDILRSEKKINWIAALLFFCFGIFESVYFYNLYFIGNSESQFSPRRPVYVELSSKLKEIRRTNEKVLVNDRLGNPKEFLTFYLGDLTNYEFRSYDYRKESDTGKLFVDILPDDPISNEPLYANNGLWPDGLNILGVMHDKGKNQQVVIYRIK